uniref:Uncharacterized protein n=1 Tax=Oryza barthii TaxID=65489 RepID=A0A0D3GX12_9ORYZ
MMNTVKPAADGVDPIEQHRLRRRGGAGGGWATKAGFLTIVISFGVAFNCLPAATGSAARDDDGAAVQLLFIFSFVFAVAGVNLITAGVYLASRRSRHDTGRRRSCTTALISKVAAFARRNLAVLGTIAASLAATGIILSIAHQLGLLGAVGKPQHHGSSSEELNLLHNTWTAAADERVTRRAAATGWDATRSACWPGSAARGVPQLFQCQRCPGAVARHVGGARGLSAGGGKGILGSFLVDLTEIATAESFNPWFGGFRSASCLQSCPIRAGRLHFITIGGRDGGCPAARWVGSARGRGGRARGSYLITMEKGTISSWPCRSLGEDEADMNDKKRRRKRQRRNSRHGEGGGGVRDKYCVRTTKEIEKGLSMSLDVGLDQD